MEITSTRSSSGENGPEREVKTTRREPGHEPGEERLADTGRLPEPPHEEATRGRRDDEREEHREEQVPRARRLPRPRATIAVPEVREREPRA